ncbi:MAG: AAA family ATPase [Deltaproteobacteria bacterium]|nr:AAA family ATPase [Deltaproteobacteria bacterium]
MSEEFQSLPIGIQNFENLRRRGYLYVDKTAWLLELVTRGERYFLSRPRRFGKSLTISTLDAMFSGKTELFRGLAAEDWVARQAQNPAPVLRLDMSIMNMADTSLFAHSLEQSLMWSAEDLNVKLSSQSSGDKLQELLRSLYKAHGPVVVLIDEYDKPILDNIGNIEAAEEMRQALRSFYTVLKSCDEYLRFVLLTGISKFSKVGVFSAMNNLNDISMDEQYGNIVGYTQEELEGYFAGWIDEAAGKMGLAREDLIKQLKDYYDGFCFDGTTRLYNPFSIMQCLLKARLSNYWYESGSPSFITTYMKQHAIQDPEEYRHIEVDQGFAASQEIERARPESFLYQSGYLTIEKWEGQSLTLDYPNREVLDSISKMYLETVYHVEGYTSIGSKLWRALKGGDIDEALHLYNTALAGIPYEDFMKQSESLYRALFLMLLRGAGISANGELHTCRGRSDLVVVFPERVVVLEFKLARRESEIEGLKAKGMQQIEERGYAAPYDAGRRAVTAAVVVADVEKRQVFWQISS